MSDEAAKLAADHAYATYFPALVVAIGLLVLVAGAAVALGWRIGPRFVRALEAIPPAGRALLEVVHVGRAADREERAELIAEVRKNGEKLDRLLAR